MSFWPGMMFPRRRELGLWGGTEVIPLSYRVSPAI
jgi:hypothetical protein